jgi:diacylglycerol diphosphate phosphatase/phosphatidate phosphatase
MLCAALIAISRLDDYRHDVYDVTVGATLGMLIGWFSYRRYYPPLRSVRCDAPYDKAEVATLEGFGRLDDEEQAISRPLVSRQGSGLEESYQMEHAEISSAA